MNFIKSILIYLLILFIFLPDKGKTEEKQSDDGAQPVSIHIIKPSGIDLTKPINTSEKNILIEGMVKSETSVEKFEFLHNDHNIYENTRWFFVPGKKEYFFSETLCMQEGTNKITINAADAEGEDITKTITVIYTLPKPQNWAVVIGIRDYYNSHIDDLKYSDSDAISVYDYLIIGRGFAEDHVMLLLNEKATLNGIKTAIGKFLREKVLKHDSVFIYYSGYGSSAIDPLNKDGDGISTYLLPYDTDPCNLYGTALPVEDI